MRNKSIDSVTNNNNNCERQPLNFFILFNRFNTAKRANIFLLRNVTLHPKWNEKNPRKITEIKENKHNRRDAPTRF